MQIFSIILNAGMIMVCVYVLLQGMMRVDKDHGMEFSAGVWCILVIVSMAAAGIWQMATAEETAAGRFVWLLIHIYFVSCSMTDIMTCQVYDLFQCMGVVSAGFLLLHSETSAWIGVSICLFALLQYMIFMRFYGAADGMAFLVAALAEGAMGFDVQMYLLHMIAAYLLLSLVQIAKGNIEPCGKLKRPIPFLPYIMVSFWGILIFGGKIWSSMG